MNKRKKPFTISVEGNIGVGKSTFLKYFEQFINVEIVPEPLEAWQNLNGSNLLELHYNNPKKWGFAFQSYTLLLMLQNHLKASDKGIRIMERSLYSARYCFINLLLQENKIEKEEFDILQKWYAFIDETNNIRSDLIIYLRATPEQSFQRINKRARTEEKQLCLNYLKQLHELHEDWLIHKKYDSSAPVLVLDANLSAIEIQNEFEKLKHTFQPQCLFIDEF